MEFKHKGCGGGLVVDISNQLRALCPSIILEPRGVRIQLVELSYDSDGSDLLFLCKKCGEPVELGDRVLIKCMTCKKYKALDASFYTQIMPCSCEECLEAFTNRSKSKPLPEHLREVGEWLVYPKSLVKIPLMEILNQPPTT
jgi:hypothetical protein